MAMAKPYRSLWVDPEPDEPDPHTDVTVRWTVESDDEEPPAPDPHTSVPARSPLFAIAVVAAVATVALLSLAAPGGSLIAKTVPSAWEDIPMSCKTVRVERAPQAVEAFRCHATGGDEDLPPGRYVTPDANWTSDLTRQEARYSVMEISPGGVLRGIAAYDLG